MNKFIAINKSLIALLASAILCMSCIQHAHAITVEDLYTIELTTNDKTNALRQTLLLQAFDHLLLKLTGNKNILAAQPVKIAKAQIDKYVSSFAYKNTAADNLQVNIVFNEVMINALLQASSSKHLGKNRPVTLIWLARHTENGCKLISEDEHTAFVTKLEQIAHAHSIPIVLPLLDLEEREKIKIEDVVSGSLQLQEIAARYKADVVLIGKIKNSAGAWQGKWTFLGKEGSELTTQGKTIAAQYTELMHLLTVNYMHRYGPDVAGNAAPDLVKLKIANVTSLENYAKILTYLRGLSTVTMVEVVDITGDGATFELQVDGGEATIKKILSMDRFLEQTTSVDGNLTSGYILQYRICS